MKPERYRNYSALQTGDSRSESSGGRNRSMMQSGATGAQNADETETRTGHSNVQWSFLQSDKFCGNCDYDSDEDVQDEMALQQNSASDESDDDDGSFIQVEDANRRDIAFQRRLRQGIHLDSGSTFSLYRNKKNIREGSVRPLANKFSYGSNVGSRDILQEGESKIFPGSFKKIDLEAKASVESLSQLVKDGYEVVFDCRIWDGFMVQKDGRIWKFEERDGLYTYMPGEERLTNVPNDLVHMQQMLWDQWKRIQALRELVSLDVHDEPAKYLVDRENKIYEMMLDDYELGNDYSAIVDMVQRARFGMNSKAQEKYVGGKVTRANMHKVMHRIYDGIHKNYKGGINRLFDHSNLEPTMMAEIRHRFPYAADLPPPRRDTSHMPFYDPITSLEEYNDDVERIKRRRFDNSVNNNDSSTGYSAVQSVLANKEGFTKKQVELANRARSAYHMAGAPDMKAFKLAVRSGLFKNCPIEETDITVAEKIYGPSASAIKGKTQRPQPEAIRDDWIEVPRELVVNNMDIDLCIDLVFINNVVALTGVDKQIKYRHFIELENRTKNSLYRGIDEIFRLYNHADFLVKQIYCDLEFKAVFDDVKDELNVHMNYASAGEHEPTAERNNQHIKAGVRTQYHRMPFKAIPKVMTVALGERTVTTSNYYPAKGGLSAYYSPYMIIHRQSVNYEKEFVAEMGSKALDTRLIETSGHVLLMVFIWDPHPINNKDTY